MGLCARKASSCVKSALPTCFACLKSTSGVTVIMAKTSEQEHGFDSGARGCVSDCLVDRAKRIGANQSIHRKAAIEILLDEVGYEAMRIGITEDLTAHLLARYQRHNIDLGEPIRAAAEQNKGAAPFQCAHRRRHNRCITRGIDTAVKAS